MLEASEVTPNLYPLGTDQQELERLQFQHRLWADAAHSLWRQAGIRPGSVVLDLGAGPGAATMDLAQLVTSAGQVVAVDASEGFLAHLRQTAASLKLDQVEAHCGDVQDRRVLAALGADRFDLAYARWLLCFAARPADILAGVASVLKPGGAFCIHDYFNYEVMTLAPRRSAYTRVVQAAATSWRDHGGDPDIVGRLPRLLAEAGFTLEHLQVHQRLARPGDSMWSWVHTWWDSYAPRLVAMGYLSHGDLEEFRLAMASVDKEHDFAVTPPVFEILARSRR